MNELSTAHYGSAPPYHIHIPALHFQQTHHLTHTERSVYDLLRTMYWIGGSKPLPDDDLILSDYAKLTPSRWKKIRPKVSRLFVVENGTWRHVHLDEELARIRDQSAKNSKAGSASARKRAEREERPQFEVIDGGRMTGNDRPF